MSEIKEFSFMKLSALLFVLTVGLKVIVRLSILVPNFSFREDFEALQND